MAQHLYEKLTERDVERRYSSEEALRHPWVTRRFDEMVPFTSKEQEEAIKARRMIKGTLTGLLMTAFMKKYSLQKAHKVARLVGNASPNLMSFVGRPISFVLAKKAPGRMKEIQMGAASTQSSIQTLQLQECPQQSGTVESNTEYSSPNKVANSVGSPAQKSPLHSGELKRSNHNTPQSQSRLQVRSIQYQASRPLRASLNWKDYTPSKPNQASNRQAKQVSGPCESVCGDSIGEDVATNDTTGKPQSVPFRKDSNPLPFLRSENNSAQIQLGTEASEDGRHYPEEGSFETNRERYSTPAAWTKTKLVLVQDRKDTSPGFSPVSIPDSLKAPITQPDRRNFPTSHKASLVQVNQNQELGALSIKQYHQSTISVPKNLDFKAVTSRGVRFVTKNGEYFAPNGSRLGGSSIHASGGSLLNQNSEINSQNQVYPNSELQMGLRSQTWAAMPALPSESARFQVRQSENRLQIQNTHSVSPFSGKVSGVRGRHMEAPTVNLVGGLRPTRSEKVAQSVVVVSGRRIISPDETELKRVKATPRKKLVLYEDHSNKALSNSSNQPVLGFNLPSIAGRQSYASSVLHK